MLKRITRNSVRQLLTSWSPELKTQIEDELSAEPPFMTVQRVASVCDVSESTVRRWVSSGELTAITAEGPNSAQAAKV